MTVEEMERLFEMYSEISEAIPRFQFVEPKRSQRADLHAFLLLDSLVPEMINHPYPSDMIAAAEHDQIYLGVDLEALAKVITPEQIRELHRCGVFISDDSLTMFV